MLYVSIGLAMFTGNMNEGMKICCIVEFLFNYASVGYLLCSEPICCHSCEACPCFNQFQFSLCMFRF